MADPVRPEPQAGWRTRAADAVRDWPWRETAALGVIGVIGACLLVVGAVWGWHEWSNRSEPPIDELLTPLITLDRADGANGVDGANGADRADGVNGVAGDEPDADGDATRSNGAVGEEDLTKAHHSETGDETAPTSSSPAVDPQPTPTPTPIVVHVSGAVTEPGVVELPAGARVFEAVDAAGGVSAVADTDRINLAAPLGDGERVHVPAVGEEAAPSLIEPDRPVPTAVPASASTGWSDGATPVNPTPTPGPIDLNRATPAELEQLPGVGPTIAQAIADLREQRGPYYSVDELLLVDGIGPAKLEALRPHAWVQSS